jgi:hypothetical protein
MTFQAYIDNVRRTTGKSPDDFHALAIKRGILKPDITATQFVNWLKQDHGLGHGHAMAMLAVFKTRNWIVLSTGRSKKAGK